MNFVIWLSQSFLLKSIWKTKKFFFHPIFSTKKKGGKHSLSKNNQEKIHIGVAKYFLFKTNYT